MADMTVKGAALAAAKAGDFSSLPIHNPAVECASREEIRALQLERLIEQVRWTYDRVAWYRERMDRDGVSPMTSRRSKTFASCRSRISRFCATRSRTGCSPYRSIR